MEVVQGDPFNSSPTDPKLMGPDALARFRKGEKLPAVTAKTPLVSSTPSTTTTISTTSAQQQLQQAQAWECVGEQGHATISQAVAEVAAALNNRLAPTATIAASSAPPGGLLLLLLWCPYLVSTACWLVTLPASAAG
jgi:hypothetical protein